MDLHNMDHYLHAFTYPGWKHIASFGRRGEAPQEMLSAINIQFNSLDSLWALDANKMEITRWKISPSTRSAERVEEIKLDKNIKHNIEIVVDRLIVKPGIEKRLSDSIETVLDLSLIHI